MCSARAGRYACVLRVVYLTLVFSCVCVAARDAQAREEYEQRRAEIYAVNRLRHEQDNAKFKVFMQQRAVEQSSSSSKKQSEPSDDGFDDGQADDAAFY